jgi:hypothetical protein
MRFDATMACGLVSERACFLSRDTSATSGGRPVRARPSLGRLPGFDFIRLRAQKGSVPCPGFGHTSVACPAVSAIANEIVEKFQNLVRRTG